MNERKSKNQAKRPVNLTLTKDAVRKGNALKKPLQRPSLSNVVEYLIVEEAKKLAVA